MTADPTRDQADLARRVRQLVGRFEEIGETVMKDLPVYNDAIRVEAVGFRRWDGGYLGVLVTPWSSNVIWLPKELEEVDFDAVGKPVKRTFPQGEEVFLTGGDEVVGRYEQLSIRSPMDEIRFHEAACVEGRDRLEALMTPPPEPEAAPEHTPGDERPAMDRRAFLRGASSARAGALDRGRPG